MVTSEVEVEDKVKVWEGVVSEEGGLKVLDGLPIGRCGPSGRQWQPPPLDSTVIGKLDRQIHQQLPPPNLGNEHDRDDLEADGNKINHLGRN